MAKMFVESKTEIVNDEKISRSRFMNQSKSSSVLEAGSTRMVCTERSSSKISKFQPPLAKLIVMSKKYVKIASQTLAKHSNRDILKECIFVARQATSDIGRWTRKQSDIGPKRGGSFPPVMDMARGTTNIHHFPFKGERIERD
ncbi:hypothetical protein TNCT_145501 [Trichonephila clavata]|uniref:Uncharacterized protein n=2 Tax=Trichonephila clavata TaxID=2740835 RepID=A0A8X6FD22_TRICU|nr:hypothetical protein TNCT_145501 [Trichonephila clavata]